MDHEQDQRFVTTDPASELHLFLWTLGIPDDARRAIVRKALELVERERERVCTSATSTN